MTDKTIKQLKKELAEKQIENFKLMWKYASLQWKIIIILGILSLVYNFYKLGQYIAS